MSNRHDRILSSLFCMAQDIPTVGKARVYSCLVYKRAVVSYGHCSYKTHPLQARFGKNTKSIYLHAEIAAIANGIQRMKSPDFLSSSTLYVARAKQDGKGNWMIGSACPCEGCSRAIASFGIPSVIHT